MGYSKSGVIIIWIMMGMNGVIKLLPDVALALRTKTQATTVTCSVVC